ncbi:asparagine synthetase B [Salinadaptatus halalkaliphilus]|uniref:Putative asparagine synthetase [glutamine-hydrolyzing] n=1 Tax=Salinadaptatus halalkaliphilus TaxID=2419781 RepID=A0A4S3TLT5_9EURY|nr:asparagine synthase-related protein [Salinadaptatus halalkaliphilus]THE65154.1 asparagine synthetase B [Salinadaptatus halalkaliphilus]
MSGIVGVFDRAGGAVGPVDVESMLESLAHRGPDGSGQWCDERVGFGHQLLAATPQATTQPYDDDGLIVTADVRLDNRSELVETLSITNASSQVPDCKLLCSAYRRWGPQCVDRLVGAFAFAIWDADRRQLFCARDHVGVKPIYYHRSATTFAFSTELKGLLALPTVDDTLDERKVGDFLTGRLEDERLSFYESITRLPPAHAMTVDADGVEQWQYWSLDPSRTITLASDGAYERRFRDLLEQAVRCRLRTAGEVGAELSGGLDSSAVTVLARELLPAEQPLQTFSNVYDDAPSSDEREYIQLVTQRDGIVPHYVTLDRRGSLADASTYLSYYDKPPHNTLHFSVWEQSNRAAEAGVDVVLNGVFGDSASNYGLGVIPQLFRTGRWRHMWLELRAMGEVFQTPPHHLFVRHALLPLVPESVRRHYRNRRGRPILEANANPTLDPDFVDRIDLRSRYKRLSGPDSVRVSSTDRLRQYYSLSSGRHAANFETIDLRYGAVGIEPRSPFADKRLLEFSLAMAPTQQFADGWTRAIVRRSLEDLLPEPIRTRPWKTMMDEAFWNALALEDDRLQDLVADPGPLARYLDADELRVAYERFDADPSSRDARALWRALSLSTWVEARSPRQPTRSMPSSP